MDGTLYQRAPVQLVELLPAIYPRKGLNFIRFFVAKAVFVIKNF
jgi:hypothetical protein